MTTRLPNAHLLIDGRKAVFDETEDGACVLFIAPDTPDAARWEHGKWRGQFTVVSADHNDHGPIERVYEFVECEVPKRFRDTVRAAFTWKRVHGDDLPPSLRGDRRVKWPES